LFGTRLSQAGTLIPRSHPILDRLGCVSRKITRNPERTLPCALTYSATSLSAHDLLSTFIRALHINTEAKFFSKLTQIYRNSSIHLSTSYPQLSPRAKRKTLVRGTRRVFRAGGGVLGQWQAATRGRKGVRPRKPIYVPADPKVIYPLYFGPP